jgi:hypothetical protein
MQWDGFSDDKQIDTHIDNDTRAVFPSYKRNSGKHYIYTSRQYYIPRVLYLFAASCV